MLKKKNLLKPVLLSISLALGSTAAISAAIPEIAREFPDVPNSAIEWISTAPGFMMMIFVIVSNFVVRKIGYKNTIIIGLLIAGISAVVPYFSNNFIVITASRLTMGIGLGLYNSLAISVFSLYFNAEERAKLIGFQSAIQGLGGAVMTFAAGQLMKISWQSGFLIYLIIFPVLLAIIFIMPKTKTDKENGVEKKDKKKFVLTKEVVGYFLFMCVIMTLVLTVQVKIASLLALKGYGTATDASNMLAVNSLAGMVTGFIFGYVYKYLKQYTFVVALLILASSHFLLGIGNSLMVGYIANALAGVSFSLFVPYVMNKVNDIGGKENANEVTSLVLVGANLGSSMAPYGLGLLTTIFSVQSVPGTFYMSSSIVAVFALVVFLFMIRKQLNLKNRSIVKERV